MGHLHRRTRNIIGAHRALGRGLEGLAARGPVEPADVVAHRVVPRNGVGAIGLVVAIVQGPELAHARSKAVLVHGVVGMPRRLVAPLIVRPPTRVIVQAVSMGLHHAVNIGGQHPIVRHIAVEQGVAQTHRLGGGHRAAGGIGTVQRQAQHAAGIDIARQVIHGEYVLGHPVGFDNVDAVEIARGMMPGIRRHGIVGGRLGEALDDQFGAHESVHIAVGALDHDGCGLLVH